MFELGDREMTNIRRKTKYTLSMGGASKRSAGRCPDLMNWISTCANDQLTKLNFEEDFKLIARVYFPQRYYSNKRIFVTRGVLVMVVIRPGIWNMSSSVELFFWAVQRKTSPP